MHPKNYTLFKVTFCASCLAVFLFGPTGDITPASEAGTLQLSTFRVAGNSRYLERTIRKGHQPLRLAERKKKTKHEAMQEEKEKALLEKRYKKWNKDGYQFDGFYELHCFYCL